MFRTNFTDLNLASLVRDYCKSIKLMLTDTDGSVQPDPEVTWELLVGEILPQELEEHAHRQPKLFLTYKPVCRIHNYLQNPVPDPQFFLYK